MRAEIGACHSGERRLLEPREAGRLRLRPAALWAGGFLYLALAAESDRSGGARLNLGLGVAVQALAWLSAQIAPEFAVAAATLVAARLAVAIFRRT